VSSAETAVRFPPEARPEASAFAVRNELEIGAPPDRVWAWLTRPDLWSRYYPNARLVRHLDGPWPAIAPGSRWRWLSFGVLVTSELVEHEPHERLAWNARELGARGHHGWVLREIAGGTEVVTEETQRGWGASLAGPLMRPAMRRQHQRWLEGLGRVAAGGPPPSPGPGTG
jgi:uncharacterized protein YndB with AHSA1/START domain